MAKYHVSLGATPGDEECAQLGSPSYHERAREECQRYINQIRKLNGPEPEGAKLKIKSFPHDFGSYLEVVCEYDSDSDAATAYAFEVENDLPANWE